MACHTENKKEARLRLWMVKVFQLNCSESEISEGCQIQAMKRVLYVKVKSDVFQFASELLRKREA